MDLNIAKAGWLHRQSSVLKRWKKRWFVLYQNGDLKCFESQDSHEPEGVIIVRAHIVCIQAGSNVKNVSPPDNKTTDCLLCLKFKDKEMMLCAEDSDDMKAWQIGLEEARVLPNPHGVNQVPPPGYNYTASNGIPYPVQQAPVQTVQTSYHTPYYMDDPYCGGYPGQVIQPGNTPYMVPGAGCSGSMVVVPSGTNTVVVQDDYRYNRGYHRGYRGSDLALGVFAGAAIGSMMWTPMLFW